MTFCRKKWLQKRVSYIFFTLTAPTAFFGWNEFSGVIWLVWEWDTKAEASYIFFYRYCEIAERNPLKLSQSGANFDTKLFRYIRVHVSMSMFDILYLLACTFTALLKSGDFFCFLRHSVTTHTVHTLFLPCEIDNRPSILNALSALLWPPTPILTELQYSMYLANRSPFFYQKRLITSKGRKGGA